RERLPREHLATMMPIRYESSDGLEIPAYLTLPKGVEPRNLPTVVVPHGGPWGRDAWGYDPLAQFFANRGYAVLQPNFRGSTGYGKAFVDAGNGEWGDAMQDDITAGVEYLIAEGIADPARVGICGGSYGGYAVLQPNFRGSTGYGKAFVDAGNGEWGDAMQDDITAGVEYLIAEGIADPERVGIFGGSYGGYAVLAGLAFTPDVYAAGVSLV